MVTIGLAMLIRTLMFGHQYWLFFLFTTYEAHFKTFKALLKSFLVIQLHC